MPRPKKYNSPAERFSAYRDRKDMERDRLNELGLQSQGLIKDESIGSETPAWYLVDIRIQREELLKPVTIQYVLKQAELLRLQDDLQRFKTKQDDERGYYKEYATYAFADSGDEFPRIPGTYMLAFEGVSVAATKLLDDYIPPPGYRTSEGTVYLLLAQTKRKNNNGIL